ncbi:4Fe-4S dicluster domain-containing protein [bacterium]|nr:4Fe-4S dicluster domain-containing protein [bacterium]
MVITEKDHCRVCYTCVRECPAKAIRIADGQAEVIATRCIGCGNCIRVCSQKAKKVLSSIDGVRELLESDAPVAAMIAPSFPAEFSEITAAELVGRIRALGFDFVSEVGFGADLVARRMKELLETTTQRYISSACPAVFGFIKRYHPDLIHLVAPVVSPMIATARMLRRMHGQTLRVVFIGPCIAKMAEAYSDEMAGEIDEVLTFGELHQMLAGLAEDTGFSEEEDFDPPHAGKGNLFPLNRGLLDAAGLVEDLMAGEIISASGKSNFIDALLEFGSGDLNARLLDVLCCDGCIMGAGMTTSLPMHRRRTLVSQHVRQIGMKRDIRKWEEAMKQFEDLDLSRKFSVFDQRLSMPGPETIRAILRKMGKLRVEDELNCGACGYDSCHEHAVAIHKGLAEIEMCLPFTIEKLHRTISELNASHEELADTRAALIQSEKMASMGQLAAGIAHEVNNPLGVVLMYAHLLLEETALNAGTKEDLKMIADHADRAKKIVSGLLHFARQNKVVLKKTRIDRLVDHVLKSVRIPDHVRVEADHCLTDPHVEIDSDQIVQVLNNLISNSIVAMPDGGVLRIRTSDPEKVIIQVSDTGSGIPESIKNKIFEPFFTTKQIGKGTGLGLSITYGIIKMHRGDIRVESNADPEKGPTGTTFTVILPRQGTVAGNGSHE